MTLRCDVRDPRWSDLAAAMLPGRAPALWEDPSNVPTHSGKSALNHVFSYLRSARVLENKNSKILTPPWLGYWVYNAIRPHGFPVLHDDPEIKAALVYHQYGFPQDLDEIKDHCSRRGIALIEDCAHALDGKYKGRPLGSEGLAGVFSLSKFYPSLMGGAVRSGDAALRAHVSRLETSASAALGLFTFGAKALVTKSASGSRESSFTRRLNELAYAAYPYSRRVSWTGRLCGLSGISGELETRRRNYALYRELLPGHEELQSLEKDATPYVVPLMHPRREALERIAASLRALGLETGIYAFESNRNLFNARYVPCVWLPVHGGIGEERVAEIAAAVKKEL